MTACECENPGSALYFECKRHGCRKHAAWWRLCRTREEYFTAWEEGRGPGQPRKEVLRRPIAPSVSKPEGVGVGSELKRMLRRIGIGEQEGCHCAARSRVMDEEGADWCEEHKDLIVSWLEEEAKRRKLPFIRALAKLLVSRAIRNTRRKLSMLRVAT